ncbi:MAG: DUF5668 domain-containing protein [Terracidiphilus sp.]|nr:DUF5668 domain-containing protein [Terracidiphilus sp.]MDR3776519.1 DUF5668 domain-containing protein [Terracidiphilus sp.]
MSRYILIRRLRGPAFLLLIGALALLNQADLLSWGKSWPLFLILAGLLALAERAAIASEGPYAAAPYPGAPYPGAVNPAAPQAPAQETSAIVPAHSQDYGKDSEGGQS